MWDRPHKILSVIFKVVYMQCLFCVVTINASKLIPIKNKQPHLLPVGVKVLVFIGKAFVAGGKFRKFLVFFAFKDPLCPIPEMIVFEFEKLFYLFFSKAFPEQDVHPPLFQLCYAKSFQLLFVPAVVAAFPLV